MTRRGVRHSRSDQRGDTPRLPSRHPTTTDAPTPRRHQPSVDLDLDLFHAQFVEDELPLVSA
jgi:hypothetical protein